jgi:multisubunit Na+/H+ antiporter MnhF subunit
MRTGVQTCRVIVNKKIDCRVVAVDGCLNILLLISFIPLSNFLSLQTTECVRF